jgi:uncharacterized membrane protein YagU involved in acid resistance
MEPTTDHRPSLLLVIAGAAVLIGTLDLIDAFVFFGHLGVPAIRVPQSIATGFLGQLAYHDGMISAAFGVMLHYLIAFSIAGVYFYISGELPLYRRPVLSGAIYGIVVYCVMNYIVIPISNFYPQPHFAVRPFINGILGHILLIGIPLGLIARRYVQGPKKKNA